MMNTTYGRSLLGLLCAALLSLSATPATASDPDRAMEMYEVGKDALRAGDAKGALNQFKAALKLAEGDEGLTWQMLLAVAVGYRQTGEVAHAVEYFRRFLAQTDSFKDSMTSKWTARRERAAQDLKDLESTIEGTHGALTITSSPRGAAVFLGAEQAGADGDVVTPFSFWLKPGKYELRLELDGYVTATRTITVRPGGNYPFKFDLEAKSAPTPVAPPVAPTGASAADEMSSTSSELAAAAEGIAAQAETTESTGPYVMLGAGGALALVGAIFTGLANREFDALQAQVEAPGNPTDNVTAATAWKANQGTLQTYETLMWVSYGAAAAAAIGGAIWLALPTATQEASGQHLPQLRVTPHAAGISGQATWSF